MKFFLLALVVSSFLTGTAFAECEQEQEQESEVFEFLAAVKEPVNKSRYNCDTKDLITGQYVTGAAYSVEVDEVSGVAKVLVMGSGSAMKETLSSTLKVTSDPLVFENLAAKVSFKIEPENDQNKSVLYLEYATGSSKFECRIAAAPLVGYIVVGNNYVALEFNNSIYQMNTPASQQFVYAALNASYQKGIQPIMIGGGLKKFKAEFQGTLINNNLSLTSIEIKK